MLQWHGTTPEDPWTLNSTLSYLVFVVLSVWVPLDPPLIKTCQEVYLVSADIFGE